MAETAQARFDRDTTYKSLDSIDDHEDGDERFARNYADVPDDRSEREYVSTGTTSALKTAINAL